jgi:predicted TIM-barrel fold metal-dependent hydrolase
MKKIDIHVHTHRRKGINRLGTESTYCSPEELIAKYDGIGVEYGVILPTVNPECNFGDLQSHEDVIEIVEQYPDRFGWFANVDPRAVSNAPDADLSYVIRYLKERGAKGVGEICANMAFNDPKVENLFHHCEINDMPVIFHISPFPDRLYGLYDKPGLPLLEGALQKFPKLKFLGHSQPFWAEIGAGLKEEERNSYPAGKVVPGRVVELMRKYPNLCGDLSAGSGFNAVSRDEAFGYAFLDEFAGRLYFGTDFCAPENVMPLSGWLDDAVAGGHIRRETYEKISRKNAEALLGR